MYNQSKKYEIRKYMLQHFSVYEVSKNFTTVFFFTDTCRHMHFGQIIIETDLMF